MHDSAAAEAMMGFGFMVIGVGLLMVLGVIAAMVVYLLNLQRCLNATRPEFRPDLPTGLVWLILIPFLGFLFWIAAVVILSTALKKEGEARQTTAFGDGGLGLGLASAILGLLSAIPLLGILLGLASLVCWILHWLKVSSFRRLLTGETAPVPAFGAVRTSPQNPAATATKPREADPFPATVPAASLDGEATLLSRPEPLAYLRAIAGPLQGQEFAVGSGVMLGRSLETDIVVGDPHVSNRHAWVGPLGDRIVLRDNSSTNGTFHNDNMTQRISEVGLQEGDVVILGDQGKVKFQLAYR